MKMHKEEELLNFIVKNLVKNIDDIKIERTEDELWILLTLKVASEDMWIIIWKSWNTVNSIRTIIRTIWIKEWKRINLKVLD